MKPTTSRDIVRAALIADPVSPLADLARAIGMPTHTFCVIAGQVRRVDGIDYHAQRLDGRKTRWRAA